MTAPPASAPYKTFSLVNSAVLNPPKATVFRITAVMFAPPVTIPLRPSSPLYPVAINKHGTLTERAGKSTASPLRDSV